MQIQSLVLGGCLLLLSLPVSAQPTDGPNADSLDVTGRLPRLVDWQDADAGRRTAELLWTLAARLDPNRASAAELATLPRLPPGLARRIVDHRQSHGPFSSVRALTAVEGLTPERLRALAPYLRVADPGASTDGGASFFHAEDGLEGRLLQRVTRTLDPGRGFEADSTPNPQPTASITWRGTWRSRTWGASKP